MDWVSVLHELFFPHRWFCFEYSNWDSSTLKGFWKVCIWWAVAHRAKINCLRGQDFWWIMNHEDKRQIDSSALVATVPIHPSVAIVLPCTTGTWFLLSPSLLPHSFPRVPFRLCLLLRKCHTETHLSLIHSRSTFPYHTQVCLASGETLSQRPLTSYPWLCFQWGRHNRPAGSMETSATELSSP